MFSGSGVETRTRRALLACSNLVDVQLTLLLRLTIDNLFRVVYFFNLTGLAHKTKINCNLHMS